MKKWGKLHDLKKTYLEKVQNPKKRNKMEKSLHKLCINFIFLKNL
jgi:hypothetical protein